MKRENLLFQLDLLESQSKNKNNTKSRLKKTKYALEKKKNLELTDEELEKRVVDLKIQLIDRKIHHINVQISRIIKNIYSLEIVKIRKRIKRADSDENKRDNLAKELSLLTERRFDPSHITELLLFRHLKKQYLKYKTPEFFSQDVLKKINAFQGQLDPIENNIFGRFCNNTAVKETLKSFDQSIKRIIDRDYKDNEEEEVDEEKSENITEIGSSDEENTDDEEKNEDKPHRTKDHIDETNSTDSEFLDFDQKIASSEEESEPETDSFLQIPELQSGYISGSDDDDTYDYENDKQVKSIVSERKNRRGQRARRQIWEMKYGRGAKHIVAQREERKAAREKKQREFEERQAKREAKKDAKSGSNSIPLPERSQEKRPLKRPSATQGLHPSWEAKKKQSTAQFQGKKMKFN